MENALVFLLFAIFVTLSYIWRELKKLSSRKDLETKFLLYSLHKKVDNLLALHNASLEASSIEFWAEIDGKLQKVDEMFLKLTQNLPMTLSIKDKVGNAAKVDGAPAWALTDPSLATLEVAADGMSALLKPNGLVGIFKVQVNADADLGEGVKSILGELDVELLAGEAFSVEIAAGTPIDL